MRAYPASRQPVRRHDRGGTPTWPVVLSYAAFHHIESLHGRVGVLPSAPAVTAAVPVATLGPSGVCEACCTCGRCCASVAICSSGDSGTCASFWGAWVLSFCVPPCFSTKPYNTAPTFLGGSGTPTKAASFTPTRWPTPLHDPDCDVAPATKQHRSQQQTLQIVTCALIKGMGIVAELSLM